MRRAAGKHWTFDEYRFVQRQLDGDHLILHLDSGDYFTLEGAANLIFSLLLKDQPLERILSELASAYPDTPARRLESDAKAFIADLKAQGILRKTS